jgi:hypothetical protein
VLLSRQSAAGDCQLFHSVDDHREAHLHGIRLCVRLRGHPDLDRPRPPHTHPPVDARFPIRRDLHPPRCGRPCRSFGRWERAGSGPYRRICTAPEQFEFIAFQLKAGWSVISSTRDRPPSGTQWFAAINCRLGRS